MNKGIYIISNKVNGKVYVGQTINLDSRWSSHLFLLRNHKHRNDHLQAAFNKYGECSFTFSVLETCENLNERECYWIEFYGGINSRTIYNQSAGGRGGGKRSIEVRGKISQWQKGRKLSESHRLNIAAANIGKTHTDEHKAYMSGLYKGRPLDLATKEKISATKKGVKASQATKEKFKDRGNRPVSQFDLLGNHVQDFKSAKEAGDLLGFWKSDITQNCMNKRKTVKSYVFKYQAL